MAVGPRQGEARSTHSELIPQAAVLQVRRTAVGDAEVPAGKDLVAIALEVLLTPDQVDFESFHRPGPKAQISHLWKYRSMFPLDLKLKNSDTVAL